MCINIEEVCGKLKGLTALMRSLKRMLPDFEAVFQEVTSNEEYKDVTLEEAGKLYREIE